MRPAKKRKTDECKRSGIASTACDIRKYVTPSNMYDRIRACLRGALRCCAKTIYLRAHCCIDVARSAQDKLRIKLRHHSTLTLTIGAGAWNVGMSGALTDNPEVSAVMLTSWESKRTVGAPGSAESWGRLIAMKVAIMDEKRPVFNALI